MHSFDAQLFDLLTDLSGVEQDPVYHPEGDALYHSLQVFQHALEETEDPALWAAALLHDVGKAHAGFGSGSRGHDQVGAELLEGLVSPRIAWLVAHHLDLLRHPARTRRRLRRKPQQARELEALRRWDLAGRSSTAWTMPVEEAIARLSVYEDMITAGSDSYVQ